MDRYGTYIPLKSSSNHGIFIGTSSSIIFQPLTWQDVQLPSEELQRSTFSLEAAKTQ